MSDDIKDLLDSTAPDSPDLPPGARADAVTTRARAVTRRNRALVAIAAVAVVGAGVGLPLVLSGGDDVRDDGRVADTSTPSPTSPPVAPCPAEPVDVQQGLGADKLPDGASSARLCPATWGRGPADLGDLPKAALEEGVDDFVADLRALPTGVLDDDCALIQVVPMPWALVISYPDGTSVSVGSPTQLCATTSIAGVERNVEDVLDTFVDAVEPDDGGVADGDSDG